MLLEGMSSMMVTRDDTWSRIKERIFWKSLKTT